MILSVLLSKTNFDQHLQNKIIEYEKLLKYKPTALMNLLVSEVKMNMGRGGEGEERDRDE